MTKTLDESWIDWEGHFFGFGYGTGEAHTIPAIKRFFELCPETDRDGSSAYDYRVLEAGLGPVVAWLLINRFAGHGVDVLEYGVSPRFAWLTDRGKRLKAYLASKTADELIELTHHDQDYSPCYPDACNCGPNGYEKERVCDNPFWSK